MTFNELFTFHATDIRRWLAYLLGHTLRHTDRPMSTGEKLDWLLDPEKDAIGEALVGSLLDVGDPSEPVWTGRRPYSAMNLGGIRGLRQLMVRVRYAVTLQSGIEQQGGQGTPYDDRWVDFARREQRKVVEDLAWAFSCQDMLR